jgi:hypothetical protein
LSNGVFAGDKTSPDVAGLELVYDLLDPALTLSCSASSGGDDDQFRLSAGWPDHETAVENLVATPEGVKKKKTTESTKSLSAGNSSRCSRFTLSLLPFLPSSDNLQLTGT